MLVALKGVIKSLTTVVSDRYQCKSFRDSYLDTLHPRLAILLVLNMTGLPRGGAFHPVWFMEQTICLDTTGGPF